VRGALPDSLDLGDDVVRLRPWHADDVRDLTTIWQDDELQRRFGVEPPVTAESVSAYVQGVAARWRAGLQMSLAVRAGDALVGGCDLDHLDAARPDLGYWVAAWARGQGYARRAGTVLLGWASESLDAEEVQIEVEPDNAASIAVAMRLGFAKLSDVERADGPRRLAVYGRSLRP
jgi:RimJ/RimL family protein N-acetyltransferase